jgi:hypothetical protein
MDKESVDGSVATQVAALTYQSQLTANMAANTSVRQEQQLAHLAAQQNMIHKNMHQIIAGLNAVTFNQSDKGCSAGHFAPRGFSGGCRGCACSCSSRSYCGCRRGPSVFGFNPAGGFPPTVGGPLGVGGLLVFPNTSLLQQGCKRIAPLREDHTVLWHKLQHLSQTRSNIYPIEFFSFLWIRCRGGSHQHDVPISLTQARA